MRTLPFLILACLSSLPAYAVPGETPLRVLVISTEPFFYNDSGGHPTGLEYDLLSEFAHSRGRELEIVWADGFPTLFPRLAAGDIDLVSASLTITPERLERFDFSTPYFPVLSMVIAPRGKEYSGLEDLKGKQIFVVPGTSHDQALQALGGVTIVYAPSDAAIFAHLAAGEGDGVATDSSAYFWYAEKYPDLAPSFSFGERSFYGFALRKGDPLKAELDAFLATTRSDGRFRRYLHAAFGKWGAEAIDEMAEGMFDVER